MDLALKIPRGYGNSQGPPGKNQEPAVFKARSLRLNSPEALRPETRAKKLSKGHVPRATCQTMPDLSLKKHRWMTVKRSHVELGTSYIHTLMTPVSMALKISEATSNL